MLPRLALNTACSLLTIFYLPGPHSGVALAPARASHCLFCWGSEAEMVTHRPLSSILFQPSWLELAYQVGPSLSLFPGDLGKVCG